MLLEKLTYADDFPINIMIANIIEDPLHYHLDIEILFVIHGSVRLKNGSCWYELHENDIFVNSGHEVHGIYAQSYDNVTALIQISTRYYAQFFPDLSKACYRTYSRKPCGRKHDLLRELLLQILIKYSSQETNFKSECISLAADVIKHLDKYFNLFAFDKDLVVNFDKSNPVVIGRISRICQYIYQYYADNITLEDLSAMERLNTFHLSHQIKRFTGMSFRDFLCFARVEWSEIPLLDSDAKISRIAREVGFSTTAYYTKYFEKWFKRTPEEHRARYLPLVKGDLRPAVMETSRKEYADELLMAARSGGILKMCGEAVDAGIKLEVNINADALPIGRFDKKLCVTVTAADYHTLGMRMFALLAALKPWRVVLVCCADEKQEELKMVQRMLHTAGFTVKKQIGYELSESESAVYDTIIYPIYLLRRYLETNNSIITVSLRDQGTSDGVLRGQNALVTSCGICKPSYFLYQAMSNATGEIICKSNQYCVIRCQTMGQNPVLKVFAYNASEHLLSMCGQSKTAEQVNSAINDTRDEISVGMCIKLPQGRYSVAKYSLVKDANVFSYLARMGFPKQAGIFCTNSPELWGGCIKLDPYTDDVRTVLNLQFSIHGAGMQVADIYAE